MISQLTIVEQVFSDLLLQAKILQLLHIACLGGTILEESTILNAFYLLIS